MRKGFTLIELIMVIVIIGILAVVAIPRYINLTNRANTAAEQGILGAVRSGIYIHYANSDGAWPTQLDNATNGSAAADNPFFGDVLQQPVDSGWSKAGNAYTGPANGSYTYNASDGTFD